MGTGRPLFCCNTLPSLTCLEETPLLTAFSLLVTDVVLRVARVTALVLLPFVFIIVVIDEAFQVALLVLIIQVLLLLLLIWKTGGSEAGSLGRAGGGAGPPA